METSNHSNKPVFVVSTGRSGSQMIARVLAEHPSVCSFHELQPHLNLEAYVKRTTSRHRKWIENRIIHKRSDVIKQVTSNGLVYLESSFYHSLLIPELYKLYNARFIHLYRDGRYFVRSAIAKGWYEKEPLKYRLKTWIRRHFRIDTGHQMVDNRLNPPSDLKTRFEKLSWLWSELNKVILYNLSSISEDLVFSFPLENLNKKTVTDLLEFMGVPADPELIDKMMARADQKPNKSKKFTSPSVADWNDWEKKRFNEIAGDMMRRLGYETSKE